MITNDLNVLVLNSVIAASIDSVTCIALVKSTGEYFRKLYATKTMLTTKKAQFIFYMSELEGNDTIESVKLCGNGATVTLDSGTAFATQGFDPALPKTSTQSLSIVWTIEII